MTEPNIVKGIGAGLIATIALSGLMVAKAVVGLRPDLNVIAMLTGLFGAASPLVGWAAHFAIGAVAWGAAFAFLYPNLPGASSWLKGISFSVGAWVLMMVVFMPLVGAGLFGLTLGVMAPIMTLVLHVIYGAVLGGAYGVIRPAEGAPSMRSAT